MHDCDGNNEPSKERHENNKMATYIHSWKSEWMLAFSTCV